MVRFTKLKVLQKADTLLDTSRLGSEWKLDSENIARSIMMSSDARPITRA